MELDSAVSILQQRCRVVDQLLFTSLDPNSFRRVGSTPATGWRVCTVGGRCSRVPLDRRVRASVRRPLGDIPHFVEPRERRREDVMVVYILHTILTPQVVLGGEDE